MNYWKQFAKMLGLELGENFVLTDDDGKRRDEETYKVLEDGLYYKSAETGVYIPERPSMLYHILSGYSKVMPVPWKPKDGEDYWYCSVASKPIVVATIWGGFSGDLCKWKCGNCFKTKGEAMEKGREIMEAIRKEFEEA